MSQFNNLNSERNLKHKVQNHEFDFMESAWNDMEQMLDQNPIAGPSSDYGHFTNFVSFSKIIKLVVPALILFSILGWITINHNEPIKKIKETTPVLEEKPETPVKEFVPPANMPIALNELKITDEKNPEIKITSEYNYNSDQQHNDTDITEEGKQKKDISKAVISTHSASFSSSIAKLTQKNKNTLSIDPLKKTPLIPAENPLTQKTTAIKSLDLVSSVDFNQHISITEFINPDTSIFYTGSFKLDKVNFKPKSMNWGLAIGASISSIDWSRFKFSMSPQAGIFVSYQLNEKYALQAELLVKNKANFNINNTLTDQVGLHAITDNYSIKSLWFVELPLMIKKKLDAKNLNLILGLRPSYIVHQTGDIENKTNEGALPSDLRDGIAAFDIGLLFGLEYQLTQQLSLNLRYAQGFTDFTKNEWFGDNDLHLNSDLQLAMHYQF